MQIEHVATASLHPAGRALRVHDDDSVAAVSAAIVRFGFRVPVLVQADGTVVDGHLRLRAAQRLVLATVPAIRADDMSDDEVRAFRLSVNRLAELAEWDLDLLSMELRELADLDLSLEGIGFDDDFLSGILQALEDDKPDPAAEVNRADALGEKWGTALGQLWNIGPHRLLIADATDAASWARLLEGKKAACVFTDPPYGVSYQSASGKHRAIANDELAGDGLVSFLLRVFVHLADHTTRNAAFYVWHATSTRDEFMYALKAAGIREVQSLVWVKPGHVLGRAHYHWAHEPCIYGCRAGETPEWHGGRSQSTVWRVASRDESSIAVAVGAGVTVRDGKGNTLYLSEAEPSDRRVRSVRLDGDTPLYLCRASDRGDVWEVSRDAAPDHPTQKPSELARRALENSTRPGDLVVDAFLGSGSAMVGAEQCGRVCHGLELSPAYAGVILERMSVFGYTPERAE